MSQEHESDTMREEYDFSGASNEPSCVLSSRMERMRGEVRAMALLPME